jgi:CHAT domain-containing protein
MNEVLRRVTVLSLSFMLLLAAGCVGQMAHRAGKYEANVAEYEGRQAQGENLSLQGELFLCDAYANTKNYAKLVACADRFDTKAGAMSAAELFMNLEMVDPSMGDIWRAQAQLETGKYAEAEAIADRALAKRSSNRLGWTFGLAKLYSLRGLARAYQKDAAGARESVQELTEMSCGLSGAALCIEDKYIGITKIHVSQGQYQEAAKTVDAAGMKGLGAMMTVLTLGTMSWDFYNLPREFLRLKVLYETGKLAEAKAGYLALLNNPATRSNGTIWWSLLFDLGRIARAEGDGQLAVQRLSEAVATFEAQRANINTEAAKIGFVGDKQAVYRELVSLLVEQGRAPEALEFVERAKSRALVDLLAERQNFAVQAQDQASPAESLKLLASLEQKSATYAANNDESSKLRSAISGARADLTRSAPELASLVTVGTTKAAEIKAQLAPDETLLEYYGQGDDLYVFTVTREAITGQKLDGKGLEAEVRTFREALGKVDTGAWKPLAQRLHARLIAPVPGALTKPRLILVSHGALHYLPWAALSDGQRFLVDRVTLQQLPSASVMQFLASRMPATARDMLLLGNPDLGDKAMDLPGAEAEARAIKGIWPGSTILMRKAATKGALTKAGQLFRVIHVAAHGEFNSAQPLASRLLMSPEGADNGQLTAGDLYSLRLNADLVTLSACETGMGKVLSGDDVVGLTRGFLYAGANNIVASLWPVSDDETKFLMTSFYGNLRKMPKVDALRQAQLETKKRYPHPFYWSAFQLTGMGK